MRDYAFAVNRKICDVYTESELFASLDNSCHRMLRIDEPLLLIMEDNSVLRLVGDNLSLANERDIEIIGSSFAFHDNATPAFRFLCGKTILAVNEVYEPIWEIEDLEKSRKRTALDIILDIPILLECADGCLNEFTDIRIMERIVA